MQSAEIPPPIRLRAPFYSVKQFVARAICHPLVGRLISTLYRDHIPSRGSIIHTGDRSVVPAVKAALFWGIYERAEVRFVKEFLRTDLTVVELGSSLGVVTSQILQKLDPHCRVVCVEANPRLLETLRRNIEENGKGRSVSVVHGAITDAAASDGTIGISLGSDNTGAKVSSEAGPATIFAPAFTLSSILQKEEVEGEYVLVSDIEGAEAGFIEGEDEGFGLCQQLIVELHDTDWGGETFTVDRFRSTLEQKHGFTMRASYGPVCVFEKPPLVSELQNDK